MSSRLEKGIISLEKKIKDPRKGLPDDIFRFVSRLTPMINVDLMVRDAGKGILLAWRDDEFIRGWHLPGGIVRFKESIHDRIRAVARKEIGASVRFEKGPAEINEIIRPHKTRGHFISLLYRCSVRASFTLKNGRLKPSDPGYLKWHKKCPAALVEPQGIYRKLWSGNWKIYEKNRD